MSDVFFCLYSIFACKPADYTNKKIRAVARLKLLGVDGFELGWAVTSVVYLRTAFCDCGTPSVMM